MRTCLIFILWGLWASAAAGSLDSLDSQLAKLKQDYAEKESTLTQAQRDLSLVQQRVRDATADLQTAQTELIEEEEAFKFAQSYALRKKMAIDAKAEAEYKAAVNKKELAADNLQRRQRAESEAIAYVQKLQADVQGLSSVVNRVGNDVAVARFEVMREKFEKETEVIFELRFSCGEEVTTKQCREMGRNAADEKAQKLGAVSLLKSVTEADLARLQVTENKVKEELIALVMRRKQLEPEESVKNGEYYGKWSMWVKGQVPESLRPQAGAVLAGGKFSPVMPVSTGQKTIKNSIGMELVLIPAGSFQMGSNEGASDEKPVHQVTISQAFYMGKTEVTQAQWTAVMGNNPSRFKGDDLPVETVSWQDAKAFIQKLNAKENTDKYRLPSEAEWGNMRRGRVRQRNGILGGMEACWETMLGIMGIRMVKLMPQQVKNRINMVCMIWLGMCGNGTKTVGRTIIIRRERNLLIKTRVNATYCAGVLGSTHLLTVVLPIVTTAQVGATMSDSVSFSLLFPSPPSWSGFSRSQVPLGNAVFLVPTRLRGNAVRTRLRPEQLGDKMLRPRYPETWHVSTAFPRRRVGTRENFKLFSIV